jgi:hypothetical protein
MGDGTGVLGLQALGSPHGVTLHVVDGNTGNQKTVTSNWDGLDGSFTPQPNGFTGAFKSPTSDTWSTDYINRDGIFVSAGDTLNGTLAFAPAPQGGIALAGNFNHFNLPPRPQVFMEDQSAFFSWGHDLASHGPVFGLGVDALNRTLVITGGASAGVITAQWFDARGTPLTGEFTLLTGFVPGPNTWFEAAPLVGGGLAVRRMDQQNDANGRPFRTAQWLVTVPAGAASATDAPQWMKDRPSTNLALTGSRRAYAVLPMGAPDADCAQKVEIVAPDGTSCGSFDIGIGAGKCRTEDVGLSLDGTPIQLMPRELVQPNTCAYRWWQHALR